MQLPFLPHYSSVLRSDLILLGQGNPEEAQNSPSGEWGDIFWGYRVYSGERCLGPRLVFRHEDQSGVKEGLGLRRGVGVQLSSVLCKSPATDWNPFPDENKSIHYLFMLLAKNNLWTFLCSQQLLWRCIANNFYIRSEKMSRRRQRFKNKYIDLNESLPFSLLSWKAAFILNFGQKLVH